MKWLIVIAVASLASFVVEAQDIYRWVDENGVINYSDQYREGAERVQIRAVQSHEATLGASPELHDPDANGDRDEALRYTMIRIVSPPDGEAIWATGGVFTVEVETVPALQPGHRVMLSLNGEEVEPVAGTQVGLTGLVRGEHTLQASVLDAAGRMQIFSQEITFHVLQASIHQPQRR